MELTMYESIAGWAIVVVCVFVWDRFWIFTLHPKLSKRYKLEPIPDDALIPRWAFIGMLIFGAIVIAICFTSYGAGF